MKRFQDNKFTMIWRLPVRSRLKSAWFCLTILGQLEMVRLGMVMPTILHLINPSMLNSGCQQLAKWPRKLLEDRLIVVMLALLIPF